MFLNLRADTSDRSPAGGFWFNPVPMRTGSGARVTSDSAMRLTAVYSCVRNISEDFAKLPFRLYKPRAKGGKDPEMNHWLVRLLMRQPNRFQTPFSWREMVMGHLALRGNGFNRIIEDGRGGISELIPMHPDTVKIEMLDGGEYRYRWRQPDGTDIVLPRGEVWHLRGLSSDGIIGLNPIEQQREALGVGLSAQEYAARFFANDAKPAGGWLEFPGKFADVSAKNAFRDSWKQMQGGNRQGEMAVLDMGMKYHEVGMTNKDSQFIEARGLSRSEIASMFRMPPHKIGDLDKATFSNIEQQSIEYGTDTISPWSERWKSSILCDLLGPDTNLEPEFDLRALMRGDSIARSAYYTGGINAGWLTRNEARDDEGLNPIDGLDEPLRPLNMVEENEVQPEPTPGNDAPAPLKPPKAPEEAPGSRFHSLIRGNVDRMAKRIAAKTATPAHVLADALAIHQEAASTWLGALVMIPEFEEGAIAASLMRLALDTP